MGIPESVDLATVAAVTELGHMSMQMVFIHSGYEGQSAGKAVCKDRLSETQPTIRIIIYVITLLSV